MPLMQATNFQVMRKVSVDILGAKHGQMMCTEARSCYKMLIYHRDSAQCMKWPRSLKVIRCASRCGVTSC